MVALAELLALAEPIILHSITGGDECLSGSLSMSLCGDFSRGLSVNPSMIFFKSIF